MDASAHHPLLAWIDCYPHLFKPSIHRFIQIETFHLTLLGILLINDNINLHGKLERYSTYQRLSDRKRGVRNELLERIKNMIK